MDTKCHGSAMHELRMEGRHSRGFTMQVAVHMNIPELQFASLVSYRQAEVL